MQAQVKIQKKAIVLLILAGLVLGVIFISSQVQRSSTQTLQSKAALPTTLQMSAVSNISSLSQNTTSETTDLYIEPTRQNTPLFSANTSGLSAVYEFMNQNPRMNSQSVEPQGSLQLQTTLPDNFQENSELVRTIDDKELPGLSKADAQHYFFRQKLQEIPVYGSFIRFDVKGSDIVGLQTKLLVDTNVAEGDVSQEDAISIARAKARDDAKTDDVAMCTATTPEKLIINRSFLGLAENDTSCSAYQVSMCSGQEPVIFNTTYYVCSATSEILFQEDKIESALSRTILDCGTGSCKSSRTEGKGAVGDSEVDRSYDILGNVYNYFYDNYKRDSYNGRGGALRASVNYRTTATMKCPNAYWAGTEMVACKGLVAADVWAHEVTHGIVQSTAGLAYQNESGALNEGFADVFGYALDSNDWTMGEDTVIGSIRNFKSPTTKSTPMGRMPDSMFSPNFYCGSSDKGGVHHNSAVLAKSLYLMIDGGTFNGCTIQGQPKEKILPVFYKALTTYLSYSSNFKSAYEALIKACGDLYGLSSRECSTVKKSLLAVEMNQGPACPKSSVRKTAPNCTGVGDGSEVPVPTAVITSWPTSIIIPTKPGTVPNVVTPATNINTPTPPRSNSTPTPTQKPTPTPTQKPTPTQTVSVPTPTLTIAPTPTVPSHQPTATPTTAAPTPTTNVSNPTSTPPVERPMRDLALDIAISFQGITTFTPQRQITVRVGLEDLQTNDIEYKSVSFVNKKGIWVSDTVTYAAPVGPYCVLIKGPFHIQKRICDETPLETYPGSYKPRPTSRIELAAGENILDFSDIVQIAGDIGAQDGVVNSQDITMCKVHIGQNDAQSLAIADLDFDGAVTTKDCVLIYSALAFKFDD